MDNEREQIEQVFGLTVGELADEPWTPTYVTETFGDERTFNFNYWYEGVPDYASEIDDGDHDYRTVCRDEMFGQVPEQVTDVAGTWNVISRFTTSGETECPRKDDDGPVTGESRCPLCDEAFGDEHGYIYIGDGWSEIVYRRNA